jgi:WD40 repeat protein
MKVWDAVSGACVSTLEGHTGGVMSVSVSPDGSRIISGSFDKTVKVWTTLEYKIFKDKILKIIENMVKTNEKHLTEKNRKIIGIIKNKIPQKIYSNIYKKDLSNEDVQKQILLSKKELDVDFGIEPGNLNSKYNN